MSQRTANPDVTVLTRLESDSTGAVVVTETELAEINARAGRCNLRGKFVATFGQGGHLLLLKVIKHAGRPHITSRVLPFCHRAESNRWFRCSDALFGQVLACARQCMVG